MSRIYYPGHFVRVRNPFTSLSLRVLFTLLLLVSIAFIVVGISSPVQATGVLPHAEEYPSETARVWFELQSQLVRETPGFTPPVASRAFGYSGVALYEAIVAGMPGYQSLSGQLSELGNLPEVDGDSAYYWPAVANSALYTITQRLFPTATEANQIAIVELHAELNESFTAHVGTEVLELSSIYGRAVAETIFAWSATDGGHEGYLRNFPGDYVAPAGEGLWTPTPRLDGSAPQPALQPYWGSNRPFMPVEGDGCILPDHPAYSVEPGTQFHQEALEVYETVNNLTPEQRTIAQYWSDDPGRTATPPGHSIAVLTQVLQQEDASLALAAEGYARVGIAVADAFISCWDEKYIFNLLRPVTYIQDQFDAEWMPVLETPPFPEYPSGHSVQSAAAAAVLTQMFGENYTFTDHTHDQLGFAPRSFSSFDEMAQEAAISRLYGGIHYMAGIELGVELGGCIGQRVNELQFAAAVESV